MQTSVYLEWRDLKLPPLAWLPGVASFRQAALELASFCVSFLKAERLGDDNAGHLVHLYLPWTCTLREKGQPP